MNRSILILAFTLLIVAACGPADNAMEAVDAHGVGEEAEPEKGPHRGRVLKDDGISLELAIFETGVTPEFRVWVTDNGAPVAPGDVDLRVTLTRLGDVRDEIKFAPQQDFLRGDSVVYEPHSVIVTVDAGPAGREYH